MTLPSLAPQTIAAVLLAAFATYSLRFGGLLLAARLPKSGRMRHGMNALPGALLFSLVLPGVVHEGGWGMLAAVLVAAVTVKTKSTFLAMLVGVAVIFAVRQLGA